MEEEGRDVPELEIMQVDESLTRIAVALEKMTVDPQVEIEAGPPICPHCGTFDPVMSLNRSEGGQGKMSQIVVDGVCLNCSQPVFIVIESYSVHRSRHTVVAEIEERERAGFFSDQVR